MKSRFSLSWLTFSILTALAPADSSFADVLQPFTPEANDNRVGSLQVNTPTTVELTGNQQFAEGLTGGATTTLGTLNSEGRIASGYDIVGAARLDVGAQNYAITIPDPITGGNTTFQVYNSNNIMDLNAITANEQVTDIVDVGDENYIDTRVADVSNGGTLNVNIGQPSASTFPTTNSWTMIAKQSSLFQVDGTDPALTSTLNWNSTNAITFNSGYGTPGAQLAYVVDNLVVYNGPFSVQTRDGVVTNFNVTSAAELRNYNDWLISQLQTGNLATDDYLTEFDKASTRNTRNIDYVIGVDDPNDDIAQPIGDRIVINANGPKAVANIASGARLEVIGARGGAVRASNGASINIDGTLTSLPYDQNQGPALYLTSGSHGTNNGVINSNFRTEYDGTGVAVVGANSNGIEVQDSSDFTNNGIVNFTTSGDGTAAINLGNGARATNEGILNIGVANSNGSGSNSGVLVASDTAQFTNSAGATIYIGRGPQNSPIDPATDTALNLSGGITGIKVTSAGAVINNGDIVLGAGVQNAAGIQVINTPNANVVNSGNIIINGKAAPIPLENIGLSVIDSGSDTGPILNSGTITLNGVNGTGLKVIASANNTAQASTTGTINILGDTDIASGTRNFGVWAEGDAGGQATANVSGTLNLAGTGAIGIHARNNAAININAGTNLNFSQGTDQIGVFAYGTGATVNINGSQNFDAATTRSTLFRIDSGAQFNSNTLSLNASGTNATGIVGTGPNGTSVNAQNTQLTLSGNSARGMVIEGGATGSLDTTSLIQITGNNSIGGLADGQAHGLDGTNSGCPLSARC